VGHHDHTALERVQRRFEVLTRLDVEVVDWLVGDDLGESYVTH